MLNTWIRTGLFAAVMVAFMLGFNTSQAATLTLDFDVSFGDPLDPDTAPPGGAAPWLTATFDDLGGVGFVTLQMDFNADNGLADITEVYFNVDPLIDPTTLTITRLGGTGPTAAETTINQGADLYQADGDGLFDIWFDFDTSPQTARFNAGEDLLYQITGAGLTAGSFNFLSAPSLDPLSTEGPFFGAAKVADTGPLQLQSDWIAVIPVPASVWLFGSALGILGWVRRRTA